MDGDVGQSPLAGPPSPFCQPRRFVPGDMLVLVIWSGRSKGEGFYPVQGDGAFPGPVGQDVYAWVPRHCAQLHVACYGGGWEWLAQRFRARGGAGRSWCSQRELWMPYGVMCTAKGPTTRCSLSG